MTAKHLNVHKRGVGRPRKGPLASGSCEAAVIHLRGGGVGNEYAHRGFHFRAGQRCGDRHGRRYLAQVNLLKRQFTRLAAASGEPNGSHDKPM